MAIILCIETATQVCSVALMKDEKILSMKTTTEKNAHSSKLTIYIDDVLKENNLDFSKLDAVAVSKGPGSYTGLRIGVSSAKGLCYALNIPLIGIETLQSMAWGMINNYAENSPKHLQSLFCPMIDARRMEVYAAIFNEKLEKIRKTSAVIIEQDSFAEFLDQSQVVFFGDGAEKCKEIISHPNAIFINNIFPIASYMSHTAHIKYNKQQFEDVAYFEPFYLKDFIAGIPKVKGLR